MNLILFQDFTSTTLVEKFFIMLSFIIYKLNYTSAFNNLVPGQRQPGEIISRPDEGALLEAKAPINNLTSIATFLTCMNVIIEL